MMFSVMTGVGRAEQLEALERAYASARAGSGRMVLVSGEAGAGKSTLVREFADSVAHDNDVLFGYCDPLSTPRPAGPLVDIAGRLGGPVAAMLAEGQRRGLFDAALAALGETARVVVFEDLHWADELTLELLGFLARRIDALPLLLMVTYRDDEVGGEHPLRAWLGSVATTHGVAPLPVPPLSVEDVAALAEGSDLDPVQLHALTGGNAFFVSELLACPGDVVPGKVADAVLTRTARLSPDARHALLNAAVLGARVEPHVLLAMDGVSAVAVDECVASGLMTFAPPVFQFRHELARQAVLAEASALAARQLQANALRVLRELLPGASARLAEHAEGAGDAGAVLEFATAAAERAASLGARREAARQYRRAVAFAGDEPDTVRADLLSALSYELHLVADLDDSLAARREAYELHERAGEVCAAADDLRWMSRISWYSGDREAAETYARRSIELLESDGPSHELGMSYSNHSQLLMLAGRYRESIEEGGVALRIADDLDDVEIRIHALNNVGTSQAQAGFPEGNSSIKESLELALAHDMEDHAARAYVNLGAGSIDRRDGTDAERIVLDGIQYCAARELDLQWRYLEANRALLATYRGEWAAAETIAQGLLQLSLTPIHRWGALVPLTLVRMRRGEPYEELLAELHDIARLLNEPQRILPVLFARAEAEWLAGDMAAVRAELEAQREATHVREDAWRAAELHYWLRRADPSHQPPADLRGGFGVALAGTPREAADAWLVLESPYDAAIALLDGDEDEVKEALATFQRLGAEPATRLARARLRELGVTAIPRGPRQSTADNPFGLTGREDDVLHLLTDGLSNAEISSSLVLSERTVHHHVSALLSKLSVPNRGQAAELGRQNNYGRAQHGHGRRQPR